MSKVFTKEQRAELGEIFAELLSEGVDPNEAQRKAAEEIAAKAKEKEPEPEADPAIKALQEKQAELSKNLAELLQVMQDTPALRNVGYFTDDGEDADPETKSFGDFLLAVQRRDVKRITKIYGSHQVNWMAKHAKDIQSQDGPGGGYLVPEEYHARLMEIAAPMAIVRSRASVIPVATDSGKIPSLDQTTAPTAGAGDTSFAGGVVANWVKAGGTLTETQPTFAQAEYVIRKLAGYTEVENEVLADSPFGIEALLSRLFGVAVAGMEDHAFLRGDGVQEPLGVLNAAAAIGITPATNNAFAYADALSMRSRFRGAGGTPVWAIHPGIWPDIGIFETTGGGGVFQANLAAALNQNILGWDIVESEHLPQDDNAGGVLLADFAAYLILDRSQMAIAFSEHAAFTTDKGTWRFTKRLDGQPWLEGAITLADPQGSYTVSPFIYHND